MLLYMPHGERKPVVGASFGVPGFLSIKMSKKFRLSIKHKVSPEWQRNEGKLVKRVAHSILI